jgi:hypothetical protein
MAIWNDIKRASAALGIASALAGTPNTAIVKNADTALIKQYGDYSRHVRLEQTGRDITRTIENATRASGAAVRKNHLTKKGLKRLD